MPKNIKESKNSFFRNYWNKTKYMYNYTVEKYKKKIGYVKKKKKIYGYNSRNFPNNLKYYKKMNPKIHMLKLPKGKKS